MSLSEPCERLLFIVIRCHSLPSLYPLFALQEFAPSFDPILNFTTPPLITTKNVSNKDILSLRSCSKCSFTPSKLRFFALRKPKTITCYTHSYNQRGCRKLIGQPIAKILDYFPAIDILFSIHSQILSVVVSLNIICIICPRIFIFIIIHHKVRYVNNARVEVVIKDHIIHFRHDNGSEVYAR